jgi:hypothetical protein
MLGFEKAPDVSSGNWSSTSLARKDGDRIRERSNSGRSSKSPANQIRDYLAQALCALLSKTFREEQNVVVNIDSGPHDSRLAT